MHTLFEQRPLKDMNTVKLLLVYSLTMGLVTAEVNFFKLDWLRDAVDKLSDTVHRTMDKADCYILGCCNRKWTKKDFQDLRNALKENVYGQNIMTDIVVPALQGHLMPNAPRRKALAISFHGRPGIGKNYVTSFIQQILFHKISFSRNIHFFSGRLHFPLESRVPYYQMSLAEWIKGNVSKCEYSLFIFDEVDKMPPKVLDAVKPFLDYHERIDGIDFRKAIFIFISNTGGDLIAKHYLQLWQNGKIRENLRLAHFEDLIRLGAFNEKGGLYRSENIESSLIDHYVPFLPLEEVHVRNCIRQEFRKRSTVAGASLVNEILEELAFGPEENPIFSNAGCKRIAPKVAAFIERLHFENPMTHTEF